jgi:hypothetical protein
VRTDGGREGGVLEVDRVEADDLDGRREGRVVGWHCEMK